MVVPRLVDLSALTNFFVSKIITNPLMAKKLNIAKRINTSTIGQLYFNVISVEQLFLHFIFSSKL